MTSDTGGSGGSASGASASGGRGSGGGQGVGSGSGSGGESVSAGGGGAEAGSTGGSGDPVDTGGNAGAFGGQPSGGAPAESGGAGSAGRDEGSGGTSDAGSSGSGGSAGETEEPGRELNGCQMYDNQMAPSAPRTITWDGTVPGQPGRCMKIRVGQSVAFEGDFVEHPLVPFGGDTPNPISAQAKVSFSEPGLYGYLCTIHSSMTGAIWVVP